MEMEYEKRLHGNNPTGAIFALKNFGWPDRQQIEVEETTPRDIKIELVSDRKHL